MIKTLAFILGVSLAWPSASHDGWPISCCSNRDCAEVDDSNIKEIGDYVHIVIPAGSHPTWVKDGRTPFVAKIHRSELREPIRGSWGVCISPAGQLLCVFPPLRGV